MSKTRLKRERDVVEVMIKLYCQDHHLHKVLCPECSALLDYAAQRLEKCPYQEGKTTCAKCPVHCYKPEMRNRIRNAMRYAGPRMIFRHPLMTIQHVLDNRRKNMQITR
jgi:hypothetical protein